MRMVCTDLSELYFLQPRCYNAKALIFSCITCVQVESSHHVATLRQGGEITSKAKRAIEIGALQVPLGIINMGSIVAVAAQAGPAPYAPSARGACGRLLESQ